MWGEELTINLFGVTLLGSVIVAAIVAKLKVWLETQGWVNTALALLVGTALGGALFGILLAMGTAIFPWWGYLLQGLFSGGIAAGLWKAARTLGRKN